MGGAPTTAWAVSCQSNISEPNAAEVGSASRKPGRLRMHPVTERNRRWWVVIAMALTTLLMTIDFNGLTVALPTIGRDLDTSTTGLQWTINAYLLALAAPSVAAGRLADIFGRRRVLLIGTVVFIAGSAASGLAQADWWLIVARVVQGFGAAAFFAASLSIVSNAFRPEERSKGIGVWAGIGTAGLAIGPLIGGFLTQTIRLVGAVFGVAVTGALFKARENNKRAELLEASGVRLDASDRAEIRGLLSGSEAAEKKAAELAPGVADQVERVVREAFVYAFDGAMLLCMAVSVDGVLSALLVASKIPQPQRTAGAKPRM